MSCLGRYFREQLIAASAAAQGQYPDKPVRIIVGFTAGSATDITARLFAQKFNERGKCR